MELTDSAQRGRGVRTREAVLDAAERLFAEHGYERTSLGEIGQAAGLSRGTPGYFFKTKEGLYVAVLDRLVTRARTHLAPVYASLADPGAPPEQVIRAFVRAHLDYLIAEPTFVRLVQRDSLDSGRLTEPAGTVANSLVLALQAFAERSGRRLDHDDASMLVLSAAAMCWFPFAQADGVARALGLDPRSPGSLEILAGLVGDFVLGELSPART